MSTKTATTGRKNPLSEEQQPTTAEGSDALLINDLLEVLKLYLDSEEVDAVYQAYVFGAEAHEGQKRHSGEAYIFHPLSVAAILSEMRLDSRSIIAALLHDVIEDTPTAKEEIQSRFGKEDRKSTRLNSSHSSVSRMPSSA